MKKTLFITTLLFFAVVTYAQKKLKLDKVLQQQLEEKIAGFKGDVGIYVCQLSTGKYAAIHADTIFPTASIVKIPLLVGLFNKIDK